MEITLSVLQESCPQLTHRKVQPGKSVAEHNWLQTVLIFKNRLDKTITSIIPAREMGLRRRFSHVFIKKHHNFTFDFALYLPGFMSKKIRVKRETII